MGILETKDLKKYYGSGDTTVKALDGVNFSVNGGEFVAIVGTIGMAGMLIKNSIVLIDEIDVQMKSGVVAYDAVIKATVSRIRPVMMASLTTILGMIPLLPDPMYGALAVTVMCGLLVGTIITLVILPIIYALFFKIKQS